MPANLSKVNIAIGSIDTLAYNCDPPVNTEQAVHFHIPLSGQDILPAAKFFSSDVSSSGFQAASLSLLGLTDHTVGKLRSGKGDYWRPISTVAGHWG